MSWKLWDKSKKHYIVALGVKYNRMAPKEQKGIKKVALYVHKTMSKEGIDVPVEDITSFLKYAYESKKPKSDGGNVAKSKISDEVVKSNVEFNNSNTETQKICDGTVNKGISDGKSETNIQISTTKRHKNSENRGDTSKEQEKIIRNGRSPSSSDDTETTIKDSEVRMRNVSKTNPSKFSAETDKSMKVKQSHDIGLNDSKNYPVGMQFCICNKNPCKCDGYMPTSPASPTDSGGLKRSPSPDFIADYIKKRRKSDMSYTQDTGNENKTVKMISESSVLIETEEVVKKLKKFPVKKQISDESSKIKSHKTSKKQTNVEKGVGRSKVSEKNKRSNTVSNSKTSSSISENTTENSKNKSGINKSEKRNLSKILVHTDVHEPIKIKGSGKQTVSPSHNSGGDCESSKVKSTGCESETNNKILDTDSSELFMQFDVQKPSQRRGSIKPLTQTSKNVPVNFETKNIENLQNENVANDKEMDIAISEMEPRRTRKSSTKSQNVTVAAETTTYKSIYNEHEIKNTLMYAESSNSCMQFDVPMQARSTSKSLNTPSDNVPNIVNISPENSKTDNETVNTLTDKDSLKLGTQPNVPKSIEIRETIRQKDTPIRRTRKSSSLPSENVAGVAKTIEIEDVSNDGGTNEKIMGTDSHKTCSQSDMQRPVQSRRTRKPSNPPSEIVADVGKTSKIEAVNHESIDVNKVTDSYSQKQITQSNVLKPMPTRSLRKSSTPPSQNVAITTETTDTATIDINESFVNDTHSVTQNSVQTRKHRKSSTPPSQNVAITAETDTGKNNGKESVVSDPQSDVQHLQKTFGIETNKKLLDTVSSKILTTCDAQNPIQSESSKQSHQISENMSLLAETDITGFIDIEGEIIEKSIDENVVQTYVQNSRQTQNTKKPNTALIKNNRDSGQTEQNFQATLQCVSKIKDEFGVKKEAKLISPARKAYLQARRKKIQKRKRRELKMAQRMEIHQYIHHVEDQGRQPLVPSVQRCFIPKYQRHRTTDNESRSRNLQNLSPVRPHCYSGGRQWPEYNQYNASSPARTSRQSSFTSSPQNQYLEAIDFKAEDKRDTDVPESPFSSGGDSRYLESRQESHSTEKSGILDEICPIQNHLSRADYNALEKVDEVNAKVKDTAALPLPFMKIKPHAQAPQTPPLCSFQDIQPILVVDNPAEPDPENPASPQGHSGFCHPSPPLSPGMVFPDTPRSANQTRKSGDNNSEIKDELLKKITEQVCELVSKRMEKKLRKFHKIQKMDLKKMERRIRGLLVKILKSSDQNSL